MVTSKFVRTFRLRQRSHPLAWQSSHFHALFGDQPVTPSTLSLTASFQQYGRFCQCIKFNALLLSASQRCWANIFLQVLGISISHQFSRLQGGLLEMCSGRAGPSVSKRQKIKQSQSTSNNARVAMKHAEGFRSPAQISSPICVPCRTPASCDMCLDKTPFISIRPNAIQVGRRSVNYLLH